MGKLVYAALASLDGYVEDDAGSFDWAAPNDDVHAFVNELERSIGTCLYGRRMYETMAYWQTAGIGTGGQGPAYEYAEIWRASEKIVYSRTLSVPWTDRTRLEREFDPEAVRRLKDESAHDLSIGGAEIGGQALRAGLVDECAVFLNPVTVGGSKPVFPVGVRLDLELVDLHRFAGGTVYLRYAVR